MEVKVPCQAVVIRYVHNVLTGEFLNFGVLLFCPARNYARTQFVSSWRRITGAFSGADPVHLRRICAAIEGACDLWEKKRTEVSLLSGLERPADNLEDFLKELFPQQDSSIQFSPILPGITLDPDQTLQQIFERFGGRESKPTPRMAREDHEVWDTFKEKLRPLGALQHMRKRTLRSPHMEIPFENAWKNGVWNVAQPLSFDLVEPRYIRDKASLWTGKIFTVRPWDKETRIIFVVGMPSPETEEPIQKAAEDALAILKDNLKKEAQIYTEDESDALAEKIAQDTIHQDID